MNLLLNILWALLGGGILTALQYFIVGLFCAISIVALPFGLQCFKIAELALFPFGREFVVHRNDAIVSIGNLFWIIVAGFWIFLSHVALALSLALTIIGLPFAFQHLKLAMLAFAPFGLEIQDKP